MKRIFKYIGVIAFAMFSFFYTDKVIELSKTNDSIMVSINEFAKDNDTSCKEGYITEDGIVLGISGLLVDKYKSYSNMKGVGYKEELIEFKKNECILTKENNIDKYILKANPLKNSVAIVIVISSGKYIDEINDIVKSKKIPVSYAMNSAFLGNNIENLENIYEDNFVFNGKDENDLKTFLKTLKNLNKEYETFCIDNQTNIIDICASEKLNTIKLENLINKNLLSNVKNNIQKGDIIFIEENSFNKSELSSVINYINGRGIKILSLNELLE